MRRRLATALTMAACCGIGACEPSTPQAEWASNLAPPARDTLSRWLFCIDCTPNSDVRLQAGALGDRAIPGLGDVLAGPPDEWRTTMAARYGRMARRIGRSGDSARIVADYLANFDAAAQRRSAILLGDIGTPSADSVLRLAIDSAQARGYRREVVRALHEALLSSTVPPYDGVLSNATPAFLDTVRVRRGTDAWDGDESVTLHGAPFPDDLVVRRYGTDSLAFVAVGQTGRYSLSITNIGSVNVTRRDTLLIRSFPAAPWTAPRDIAAASLPRTDHQSLARITTPRDTIHSFRFRPTADITVNATVDWDGAATMSSVWEDCSDRSFPGPPARVAGVVVDQAGVGLGGAQVTLSGTALGAVSNSSGQFTIVGVPPGWTGNAQAARIGYQPTAQPAREGRSGYWVVLRPPGPPPPPFAPQTNSGPSPQISSLAIPGGTCRLLSLIKTDSTTPAMIARLRLTP